jgi:hypothetical protein
MKPLKSQEILKTLSSWINYQALNLQVLSSFRDSRKLRRILPPY